VLFRGLDYFFASLAGILPRFVFWELLRVFVLCLTALAGVFTLIAVLQQFQFGLTLGQVVKVLPLLVPSAIPWITPPSCLFAACVVYGRLSHDNESLAMKGAGLNLYSLLRPAIALGIVAGIITAVLQFQFTPYAIRQSKEMLIADPAEAITLALKKERSLPVGSSASGSAYTLYVRDVQDERLLDVVVKHKKREGNSEVLERVARTREASIRVDLDLKKVIFQTGDGGGGWVYWTPNDNQPGYIQSERPIEFDLPEKFSLDRLREGQKENEMSIDWLDLPAEAQKRATEADYVQHVKATLAAIPKDERLTPMQVAEIALREDLPVIEIPAEPVDREAKMRDCDNRIKYVRRLERKMQYEYQARLATASACIFFALLGCPVGLWANRADFLSIFVICFLPALIVYYPILFMIGGYARAGQIPMILGVWTANGVLALASVVLTWRLVRR
jgi:lipopolysaccharide export system permease protein